MCGCGGKTSLVTQTDNKKGLIKGQHRRYVNGHQGVRQEPWYEERDCGYETPCWVWLASCSNGYAQVRENGTMRKAYKVYYERAKGPVPEGLDLDHLCRVTTCVNPDHLEPVTHRENIRRGALTTLTADDVRLIRASTERHVDLAKQFGVMPSTIYQVRTWRTWKDVS